MKTPAHPLPEATITVAEVRFALAAIVASPAFSASPQLAAFLRFVVEATLTGQSDRIKGYTIAVEALGRDPSFDPQADPIVRVEAGRLRRALDRYYNEAGRHDPVIIELPRGSYVPVFRHRHVVPPPPRLAARLAGRAAALAARGPRMTTWLALGIGILGYGIVDFLMFDQTRPGGDATAPQAAATAARPGERRLFVGPSIYIAPVAVNGDPSPFGPVPALLETRLRDVFARFDDVTVISELPSGGGNGRPPADYRLVTGMDYGDGGTLNVRFHLVDEADGSIAWTRLVEGLDATGDQRGRHVQLAREIAGNLLQPMGIIHARERTKQAARHDREPRYACLLESFTYFRDYDHLRHAGTRACLEETTAQDPTFAGGLSALARVYFREYLFGLSDDAASRSLERALDAARRAIDVSPGHVRAHYVLVDIHMARGEIAEAMAAGERVLALNPYDTTAVFHYAAQLVLLGDIDRGMRMIRDNVRHAGTTPMRFTFIHAIAAYLKNDHATALAYANQLTNDRFPLGLVLQAVTRLKTGDRERARAAAARLANVYPTWRDDPRRELKKYFPLPWVVDRVENDLREAGLGDIVASVPTTALPPTRPPVMLIEPIEIHGAQAVTAPEMGAIHAQIVRAFSRFEDISIVAPPATADRPDAKYDYRLAVAVDRDDGGFTVAVRLIDGDDGTALWTRTYANARAADDGTLPFIGEMAGTILHPIGVLASRERLRTSERPGFARYRCMLEAIDYLRSFVPARHDKARACLEQALIADPGFASGFTTLARIYLREHQFGALARAGDSPPLERALAAAQRAIALNPSSARAHFVMFDIRAAMGDVAGVRRHGEIAVLLNPNDQSVVFHYGAQLIMLGEVEAGLAYVRRVTTEASVPPARLDFALFLASYLTGDMAEARRHARRITNDAFVPGHVARAVAAHRSGDVEATRQALDRLVAVDPAWRSDAHGELAKFITAPDVVERFARDLAAAGLGARTRASQDKAGPSVAVQ